VQDLYDVAIIGGGPAGLRCAKCAAGEGLSVILFEENEKVGEPVHCGECLSKLCEEKYSLNLPLETISQKVKGIRVVFPSGKETFLDEPGYVLEKNRFEAHLAEQAEKEGAEILLGEKVEGVTRGDVWLVQTNKEKYTCRILIDASGSQAFLSSFLKLGARYETVIGMQYEMKEVTTQGYVDFYLDVQAFPHGYFWVIPKGGNRANVGMVTNEKSRAKVLLDEYVKKMGLEGKKVNKTFGGLIPASGPLPKTYGAGFMLIGDAAGFTSPLFEGGTHLSIASGGHAARVAAKAVQYGERGEEFFSNYEKLWKADFPKYEVIMKGKKALYNLTNAELNAFGNALPKRLAEMGALDKMAAGMRMAMKAPQLFSKDIFSVARSLGYSRAESYGW